MRLSDLVKLAHHNANDKGFWEEGEFGTRIALCHSELSEALEEARQPHDRDVWAAKVGEELADAVIRIADICGGYGIDLESAVKEKMERNKARPHLHGKLF